MRARALLVAEVDDDGRTRLVRVRSEPPLVIRATPRGIYLVGGAAGPLGGDDLALDVELGPGAMLTVRTAAASVVLPGPDPSTMAVAACVGAGAVLRWLPEPVVAVRGCHHRTTAQVELDPSAALVWREELVLGRLAEPGGWVASRLDAEIGGRPLLRHELALGPAGASRGPAVVGPHRAAGSVLVVRPQWGDGPPAVAPLGPGAAVLALEGPGAQVVALCEQASELRRYLEAGTRALLAPAAPGGRCAGLARVGAGH